MGENDGKGKDTNGGDLDADRGYKESYEHREMRPKKKIKIRKTKKKQPQLRNPEQMLTTGQHAMMS